MLPVFYPEDIGRRFVWNAGNHLWEWFHNLQDHNPNVQCCENLTSKTLLYIVFAGIHEEILMNVWDINIEASIF